MASQINRLVVIAAENSVSFNGVTRVVDLAALRDAGVVTVQYDRARDSEPAYCHIEYRGDRRAMLADPAGNALLAPVLEQWRAAGEAAERTRRAAEVQREADRKAEAERRRRADEDAARAAEAAKTYADRRCEDYPPPGDQLDALWKGGKEAEAMRARIQAVKAQYPKPNAGR